MSATCRRHDTECRRLGKKTTRRHPTCGAKLDPPFGDPETSYASMDDEMIGRAQIYNREVDCDEDDGPWSKVFVIDSATVYTLMEKAFGKSAYWTNARIYSKKKEGRKAWRGLITYQIPFW